MSRTLFARRPGQTIIMFALLLPVFLGMLAIGTDLLIMYVERRAAQGVADLAAMSGAPMDMAGSPSPAETQARATATANGYTNGVGGVVVQISYPSAGQMRVRITKAVPTTFAMIFNISTTTVLGQATAGQTAITNMAIFGNNPLATSPNKNTVDLTGGGSGNIIGGSVYSQCELNFDPNKYTITASVMYNGSNSACGIPSTTPPSYAVGPKSYPISPLLSDFPCDYDRQGPVSNLAGTSPLRNPYANELNLVPPTTGAAGLRHTGEFDLSAAGGTNGTWWLNATTLKPGVYCIQDGDLKWTGTGSGPFTGNVTFVLAGGSSQVQTFNPNAFTLTPYRNGMIFFNANGTGSQAVSLGGSGGAFSGIIYAPFGTVALGGNGLRSLTGAIYSDYVNFTGGGWTLTGTGVANNFFTSYLAE